MEIVKGSVVIAKAGRDKGNVFVVTDLAEGFAYISDGKSRPVERPKRKNLMHLQPTSVVLAENLDTNRKIKKALSNLKNS